MKIAIYGSGGFGKEVLEIVKKIKSEKFILFIDDVNKSKYYNGIPILSFENFKKKHKISEVKIVIALGEPRSRRIIREKVEKFRYRLCTVIHPNATISDKSKIGSGCIICQYVVVGPQASIGSNSVLNIGAIAGHDVKIGTDTVISSKVNIGGGSKIGDDVYLGMNSCIKEQIKFGNGSVLSMGSVLHKSIDDNIVAVGNPARPSRKLDINHKIFK